jgi:beta-lactamase regulating signal transducer with metallopeptidase domain/uncharacterized GH25 family protein
MKNSHQFLPQGLSTDVKVPAAVPSPTLIPSPPSLWERLQSISRTAAPFVVILYAIGVALMFVKLAFGVRVSRRLRCVSRPISDAHILARMAEQAKKLSMRIAPVIACCEQTAVPIVVGVLRPMILIPAAMVNGLTIEQLEFVLTHELAHLRRRDHWMIVVQRVLEAILFFHPVTWYLSHRIHDDRETSCDDLVLSMGCDRLQYAQSLLRVAELRLAGQSHQNHIALAADGQRPSKLRQRIAKLLGESDGDSVRVSSVWLVVILTAIFVVGIWMLNAIAEPVVADEAGIKTAESRKLIYDALASVRSIRTAHVKFRMAGPGFEFRKTLTPKYVRQLIEENDLVQNPDNLRPVLGSFVNDASQLVEQPWSNIDLYREGKRVRTTTSWANHDPDEVVTDDALSLRWDGANWQMDITPIEKDRYYQETLSEFLVPDDNLLNGSAGSVSMHRYLERFRGEGSSRAITTDPQTGNVLSVTIFRGSDEVKTEYLRFGWKKYNDQIWFPTVVAELHYENGNLADCKFIIVEQAIFNGRLPTRIFQLGAAAGSVIVDKREGANRGVRINHDVFDVTSVEQVQAALEPLSKELTRDEEIGVDEATRLYALHEGTALKRIGPPFPLARKFVSRMLGYRTAHKPRERSEVIRWSGTKFESYHSIDGGTFSVSHLARLLTGIGSAELEGDKDLVELSIPGDFVFREGASKEALLRDLQEIVSDEARVPVKIEFRDVERNVYRASGELKLNLPEGLDSIAMNGGPHTGHFGESIRGGNAGRLLLSLSAYIRMCIVNEVTAPNDRLEWSERWYDLESTKPEDRFRIDPAVVLEQITEQTGIRFTEEKQVVPVLFIERVKEERSTVDAGKPLSGEKSNHVAIPEQQVVKPTTEFIVTDDDGQPISDGEVKVSGKTDKHKYFESTAQIKDGKAAFFLNSDRVQEMTVDLSAPEHMSFLQKFVGKGIETPLLVDPQYNFRLNSGIRIGGTVLNESGKPIEGVEVNVNFPADRPIEEEGCNYIATSVTTNAAGKWELAGVPANLSKMSFTIRHQSHLSSLKIEGILPEHYDGLRALADVRSLKAAPAFTCTVIDPDGKPINGAMLVWMGGGLHTTNENGFVQIPKVPVGPLEFTILSLDWAPLTMKVSIPQTEPVTVIMQKGKRVEIRAVDLQGKPIEGMRFYPEWPQLAVPSPDQRRMLPINFDVLRDILNLRTNADGLFVWENAPELKLGYRIWSKQYLSQPGGEYGPEGSPRTLTFRPVIPVSMTIIDAANGRPITDARIMKGSHFKSNPADHWEWRWVRDMPDSEGRQKTSLRALDHVIQFRVQATGYRPALSQEFDASALPDSPIALQIRLDADNGFSGVVLRPDGRPAAGAMIYTKSENKLNSSKDLYIANGVVDESQITSATTADQSGKFQIQPHAEPFGCLIVHDSGYLKLLDVELLKQTELKLLPWASVKGELWLQGVPAANISVQLRKSDLDRGEDTSLPHFGFAHNIRTDASGKFAFPKCMAGEWDRFIVYDETITQERLGTKKYEHYDMVQLRPGEERYEVFGRDGADVVGRVMLPADPEIVMNDCDIYVDDIDARRLNGDRPSSTHSAKLEADGSFRILNLEASTHKIEIFIRVMGERDSEARYTQKIVITPERFVGKSSTDPIDLGEIQVGPIE